jgi:hypothetical protein
MLKNSDVLAYLDCRLQQIGVRQLILTAGCKKWSSIFGSCKFATTIYGSCKIHPTLECPVKIISVLSLSEMKYVSFPDTPYKD